MEEIGSRCVQLKSLPATVTQETVRQCLDESQCRSRYEDVYRHEESQDDIRWLVLFKTREDADRCIRDGLWQVETRHGRLDVFPDYCSDCIVPLEWRGTPIVDEDWVVPLDDSIDEDDNEPFDVIHRNRLDSVTSDDLFQSGNGEEARRDILQDIDSQFKKECSVSAPAENESCRPKEKRELVQGDMKQHEDVEAKVSVDSWHFSGSSSVMSGDLFGSGRFDTSDKPEDPEPTKEPDGTAVEDGANVETAVIMNTDARKVDNSASKDNDPKNNTVKDTTKDLRLSPKPIEETSTKSDSGSPNYDYPPAPQMGMPGFYPMPMTHAMDMPYMMGNPPGSMPGSAARGTQQPMFYPPMQAPSMPQQAPMYAGQQPMFYMPVVMTPEGKWMMMPGSMPPTMAAPTSPMTPTTMAPSAYSLSAETTLGGYDVPVQRQHLYTGMTSGPVTEYTYMSQHRQQNSNEQTPQLIDTIYDIVDESKLLKREPSKVEPPPLPPRSVPLPVPAEHDPSKSTEQREDKTPKGALSDSAKCSNEQGLKIFHEAAESDENDEEFGEKEEVDEMAGEMDEKGGCRKIKVSGFTRSISKDTMELYFENEKRSGGGDVVNISMKEEEGEAIIEFQQSTVVQRILEKQAESELVLSGVTLRVDLFNPQFDKRKFCITEMSEKTTKESLKNFFEARCGHVPVDIIKGETPGTALIVFALEQDFKKLNAACRQRRLEGQYLNIHEVEVTRSVKVTGWGNQELDALTFYFENKRRSQGGDVESVTPQTRTGAYIVTFVNAEDAELVCKQESHFINQTTLLVSLYYPCLDLDKSLMFTVPSPIELQDIESHLKRFILNNKLYWDLLVAEVAKVYGHVNKPKKADDCIKISCTVNQNDIDGRRKVENWSTGCLRAVDKVLSPLHVDDSFHVAKEAWEMFKERLVEISIDEPDKVSVFLKSEIQGMVVVGDKSVVNAICMQARKLASELEQQIDAEQHTITKTKKVKRYQIILLSAARFMDKFRKSQVNIEMSHDNAEVTIKGNRKDVDEAMEKLIQTLNSFVKKQLPGYKKPAFDLLFPKVNRSYIKDKLWQKKVIGVWDVTRDKKLELFSKSESDLKVAENVLRACLKQKTIPLDSHTQAITHKPEWHDTLKKLDDSHANQFKIEVTPGELYIAAIDSCFDDVVSEVQGMFDLHSILTDFIEIDAGKFRFMCRHKKQEVDDIQKQYSRLAVEIIKVDERNKKGFKIKGTKNGCKLAVTKIKQLSDGILLQDCDLCHPYVHEFINTTEGKQALGKIELSHSCVLEVANSKASSSSRASASSGSSSSSSSSSRSKAPEEPHPLATCYLGPILVGVVEGDMTNMKVDAVVNPTNATLDSRGVLSAAILEKGGSDMQRECGDQRRNVGKLSEGNVVVTGSGRLPCKGVIHLRTPFWLGGVKSDERSLKLAIKTCIDAADRHKFKTLALPLIGFGKDKFPLKSSVKWLVESLDENLKIAGKYSYIENVYICDIRPEIVKEVIKVMSECLQPTCQVKLTKEDPQNTYGTPMEVDDDSGDDDEEDMGGATGGRSVSAVGGLQASVVVGELAKQKVDVIVNSTNQDLILNVGMASKSLLRAGGDVLQTECQQNYPKGIQPGDIAVTSGGAMACRHVFHGVLYGWDGGQGGSERFMANFVETCLKEADKRRLTSIAFPALGTGQLGYPADVVAQLMFDTVAKYQQKHPSTKLQHVMVVVWEGDKAAIKGFQKVEEREKRRTKQGIPASAMDNTFLDNRLRETNKFKKAFGSLAVTIEQGDITKEMSNVIVNSVIRDLNLNTGNVSKAILAAAGLGIQRECNTPESQTGMDKNGIVVTSAGHLRYCKKIFHVESKSSASEWQKIVLKCLIIADSSGMTSISFPALGTGGKGCSPEDVTRAMVEAFKQFSQSPSYKSVLKQVRIVIFQEDMVPKFVAAARGVPKSKIFRNPFSSKKSHEPARLTVYVYSDSASNIQKAKRDLEDLLSAEEKCYGGGSSIQKLEPSKVKVIQEFCKKLGIEVSFKSGDGFIKLTGYGKAMDDAKGIINGYLRKQEQDLKQHEAKTALRLPSHWMTFTPDSPLKVVGLSSADPDYNILVTRFNKEVAYGYTVVKVERIENPKLYRQYFEKKTHMNKARDGLANEKSLWHGTRNTALSGINRLGFYTSSKTSTPYGTGAVFTSSVFTCATSYCTPDSLGQNHIYLANVLVGNCCQGQQGLTSTSLSLKTTGGYYDSTTDTTKSMYVIYDDSQAYPSYHVVFQ